MAGPPPPHPAFVVNSLIFYSVELHLQVNLASIFLRRSSVLFIFSLAAAPPHQPPLLVLVRQFPPQRHLALTLAVTLCLSVRRFPHHCRHHVVEGRHRGLRGRRGFAG